MERKSTCVRAARVGEKRELKSSRKVEKLLPLGKKTGWGWGEITGDCLLCFIILSFGEDMSFKLYACISCIERKLN